MSAIDTPFSRQMRIVTRQKHKLSDALVNAKLVFALSDPSVWLDGLLCFHPIFAFLEQHVPGDELRPELHRAAALEADIRYYCDLLERDAEQTLAARRPSVVAYLRHLDGLRAEDPRLLQAYVYHLYMGMLSGGQILNKKRRMFALRSLGDVPTKADDGYRTTSYDTGDGRPTVAELKAGLREQLDALGASASDALRKRLLDESICVFELNNAMVRSIRGGGRAALRKIGMSVAVIAVAVLVYRLLVA